MARKRNKCKVYLWTQGALISFKEGDLIQTRCGKRSVQVQYANPMGWDEATNDIYYGMVTYQESIFKNDNFQYKSTKHTTQIEFLKTLISG